MTDESSHQEPAQAAKQAMSAAYNEAIGQAGPGMAANALVLAVLLQLVSSIITFLRINGGSINDKWSSAFSGIGGLAIWLILALVVLKAIPSANKIMPLNAKTLCLIIGIVGLAIGGMHLLTTLFDLVRSSSSRLGQVNGTDKFQQLLINIGYVILALTSGLWGMSESNKSS